jgi:hypothetical protein
MHFRFGRIFLQIGLHRFGASNIAKTKRFSWILIQPEDFFAFFHRHMQALQAFRLKVATTEVAKLHNVHDNSNLHPKVPHLRSRTRANSEGIPVICRGSLRRAAALCGKMVKRGASTSPHAAPRLGTMVIVENIHHASTSYWCCSLM